MTVVPSDVTDWASEFSSVDDEDIQRIIDHVERRTNREAWGVKADDGVIFLTLHFLTKRAQGILAGSTGTGTGGSMVSRKKIGPIETEYATPSTSIGYDTSETALGETAYGREYLALRSTIFASRVLG